jgi:hypothetical protein
MAEPSAKEATSPTRTTFYRRPLPGSCIEFASNEGKKLFVESLQQGMQRRVAKKNTVH